ncbi:MAG: TolC family protein [Melioribacteraceae bacterium]|nr:TolC family protein [Melioribacteraceae bacterium]
MRLVKLLTILSLFSVSVTAQQALTLNDCIQIALENNHQHRQTVLDREKAEEQVREAYGSSLFPSINGTVTYNRAVKRARFIIETPFFSGSFPVGSENTLTASVNAEQPLFTGAMFLAVQIAETFAEISKEAEAYSETELVLNVKQAYYTYLLAKEMVGLAEMQMQRAGENLKNVKSMYDAGLVAEYDYIKANVQYQNAVPSVTEAKNQVVLAASNLKLILGMNINETLNINDSLETSDVDVNDQLISDYDNVAANKLLRQMELQTEMQDLVKSYQFTEHFPKLTAFGNWQSQAQENDRALSNWRFFNSISVGLTLKVPIFRGFTLDSKVEQAELDYKKAVEGLANTKKAILNEYKNTINNIEKTRQQIKAYKIARTEAQKGYDIAVKRYNTGLGTQLEVTDALLGLTNAEVNLMTSIHEYLVSNARLDLLAGKNISEIKN